MKSGHVEFFHWYISHVDIAGWPDKQNVYPGSSLRIGGGMGRAPQNRPGHWI